MELRNWETHDEPRKGAMVVWLDRFWKAEKAILPTLFAGKEWYEFIPPQAPEVKGFTRSDGNTVGAQWAVLFDGREECAIMGMVSFTIEDHENYIRMHEEAIAVRRFKGEK